MAPADSTLAPTRHNYPSEHNSWRCMWSRCTKPSNSSWKYYGAVGVTVCERWNDFATFLADMGPKPTKEHQIGRQRNAEGYKPDNCRWETPLEQAANTSKCRWLEHDGKRMHLADWSRETGLGIATITSRLAAGWSVADALTTKPTASAKRYRITFNGITRSLSAWAASIGLSVGCLRDRLASGWSVALALTTPPGRGRPPLCFFVQNSAAISGKRAGMEDALDRAGNKRKLAQITDDSIDLGALAPVAQLDRAMVFEGNDEGQRREGDEKQ